MSALDARWALRCALLCALGVAACAPRTGAQEPRVERSSSARGAAAQDNATMAVLYSAQALHQEADVFEASGDFAGATRAIERVLALRIPPTVAEADDLRLDALGRLAELALAAGEPERARTRCDEALRGLAAARSSVLVARLHLVRGRALRALGDAAATRGDEATAAVLRREAVEALEASIEMNQRVLGAVADGGV